MKRLAIYFVTKNTNKVLKYLEPLLFEKEITPHGAIYFEAGSEREKFFLDIVKRKRIKLTTRSTRLSCTKREITQLPFFYLQVKTDREYGQQKAFDMSNLCVEYKGNSFICSVGIKQQKKIMINPNKSKKLDIMTVDSDIDHQVIIVTSRLKNLLEEHRATGCKFIPCLEWGKDYPDEIQLLDTPDENLAKTTDYFQLLITESVNSPPSVGHIRFSKVGNHTCQECGTVYLFASETNPIFSMDDLRKTDFQKCNHNKTSNKGIIRIAYHVPIVSSRILDLILRHKMKGWFRAYTDPPIEYDIVEIRGVTPE